MTESDINRQKAQEVINGRNNHPTLLDRIVKPEHRRLFLILSFIITIFALTVAGALIYLYIESHPKLDEEGKPVAPLRDIRVVLGFLTLLAGGLMNHAFTLARAEAATRQREQETSEIRKELHETREKAEEVAATVKDTNGNGLPCCDMLKDIAARLDRIERALNLPERRASKGTQ
jgi:vancomycin permeability regulator SanA